ncbi:MAG: glycosyltransferase family 2 protein [PVC group bacterium]
MKSENNTLDLSIVMPALNEEANIAGAIEHTLEAFFRYGLNGEIIVVNDGSTDETARIAEEIAAREGGSRIRMIHHRTPQGLGAAFRDGLAEAEGEAVAFMPGDDENDPGEIVRYYGLLGQVDMVVPFVYNKDVRPKLRNLISTVFRMIVNITFGVNFNYTNGTVLYRRAILASSPNRSSGFFFQTENVVRAVWSGYLFAEVPYRLAVRSGGESKAISLRSLRQVMGDYLALVKEIYFSPAKKAGRKPAPGTVSDRRRRETIEIGLGKPGKYSRE